MINPLLHGDSYEQFSFGVKQIEDDPEKKSDGESMNPPEIETPKIRKILSEIKPGWNFSPPRDSDIIEKMVEVTTYPPLHCF